MGLRLKAEFYVQALLRRAQGGLAAAYVARRGDADAGGIFVCVNRLDGTVGVLTLFTDMDGERRARTVLPPGSPAGEADALMAREAARDPDIWVVDIEDAAGRHFVEEPLDGKWG